MTHTSRLWHMAGICLSFFVANACSQDISEPVRIHWGASGGINQYKEPGLMQLKGPELGLHARVTPWADMPSAQLEGDIFLGQQKYTSQSSGSMNGVTNLETRWRALWPVMSDIQEGLSAGLALHTLWNDLRGTTTFQGTTYGGYQRSASQLWLPMRWRIDDMWELDAGLLIFGRHTSKLSEVNTSYQDIVNTQHRGQYAQVAMNVALSNGESLKPFVRYTHLADSNTVAMGGKYWIEPESHRWQIGMVWEFATP
ncbi:hypothetical protein [Limnohabitans sp. TEGF004]|jgi:hypothetical protein|uniref:hypothetical protein n=1 Tax=Limnohabitans sp. TEGF004 TaxID=2986281 RepID=UPI0023777C12|nr:hypothetical protein [Limnohabitans sp. TEGF004]BDU56490.1 hypothetical protein LTEGF4_21710 [Limnohabitans sp. TEGF004]